MKKYSSHDSTSYTLGMSLTIEALKGKPESVLEVYLSKKVHHNEHLDLLYTLCQKHRVPIIEDESVFEKLSLKENCYAIAVFKKFETKIQGNDHIVLYNFKEEGSLGTTIRSAISFDHHDLILIHPEVDLFDPRVIRSSMGAIFHSNIEVFDSLEAYKGAYPNQNHYPILKKGSVELKKVSFKTPFSLLISDEYNALSKYYEDGIYLAHQHFDEISLATLAALSLHHAYHHQSVDGNYIFDKVQK